MNHRRPYGQVIPTLTRLLYYTNEPQAKGQVIPTLTPLLYYTNQPPALRTGNPNPNTITLLYQ